MTGQDTGIRAQQGQGRASSSRCPRLAALGEPRQAHVHVSVQRCEAGVFIPVAQSEKRRLGGVLSQARRHRPAVL